MSTKVYTCLKCGATSAAPWIDSPDFCSREHEKAYLLGQMDDAAPESALEKPKSLEDVIFGLAVARFNRTQDNPERPRAEVYARRIVEGIIDDPVLARALYAANCCAIEDPPIVRTAFQEDVRRAVRDWYVEQKLWRSNREKRADAAARVLADAFTPDLERRALMAAAQGFIACPTVEEQASEREAEIERNRRRPRKPPLYPV